jgi:PTH1 family peptidyl-tRNA hydrolase
MVVDLQARRMGVGFKSHKGQADVARGTVAGIGVVLMKPRSYVNLSGGPAAAVRNYYKIPLDRVVVVHDELDLPYGTLRLKTGGGDGGHNGLRSLTRSFGSPDYHRVRVGIGRPPGRMDPANYVLRNFDASQRADLDLELDRAADAVVSLVTRGLAASQNAFHG